MNTDTICNEIMSDEYSFSVDIHPTTDRNELRLKEKCQHLNPPMENQLNLEVSVLSTDIDREDIGNDNCVSEDTRKGTDGNAKVLSVNHVRFNLKNSFREIFSGSDDNAQVQKVPNKTRFRKLSPASLGTPYGNWKRRKRVRKTSEQRRKELFDKKADKSIRSSMLCISIAVTFCVLTMPSNFRGSMIPIEAHPEFWTDDVVSVTNFLEGLNYSCNFFIYCFANSIIRKQVRNDINHIIKTFKDLAQRIKNLFIR